MKKLKYEYYSSEEIENIVRKILRSNEEYKRLVFLIQKSKRPVIVESPSESYCDMINNALFSLLKGNRHLAKGVDPTIGIRNVVGGIYYNNNKKKKVDIMCVENLAVFENGIAKNYDHNRLSDLEDMNYHDEAYLASSLIEQQLSEDKIAKLVYDELNKGKKPREIRLEYNISEKDYEKARKKINRIDTTLISCQLKEKGAI